MITQEINFVTDYIHKISGVKLDESKAYLIESRLSEIIRREKCGNYRELCLKAQTGGNPYLREQIVDAITTHETLFFRDNAPFEALRKLVIPHWIAEKSKNPNSRRIRIWSAGCSTGQEPYSIAMTLWNALPNIFSWDISILGTDISDASIKQASLGRFTEHEVQRGLNADLLAKFFVQESAGWRVKDELRSLVTFRRYNLLDSLMEFGPFDAIFCRNVAIYFDEKTRSNLFYRLSVRLANGGFLFVGSAESLADLGREFTPRYYNQILYYQPNLK
ncbi:MAG: protein-glutamate O-methyltransferase CheR [Pirellulales bacterium]|nr:protein-glutamate O-methyltransferase CheR [Pirellulales bacterium]